MMKLEMHLATWHMIYNHFIILKLTNGLLKYVNMSAMTKCELFFKWEEPWSVHVDIFSFIYLGISCVDVWPTLWEHYAWNHLGVWG